MLDVIGQGIFRLGVVLALGDGAADVELGEEEGFAGFAGEDLGEEREVVFEVGGELCEERLALGEGGELPGFEGGLGGGDGVFEVLGGGNGARPEGGFGSWVGDGVGGGGGAEGVVDYVVEFEFFHFEGWRLVCV